MMVSSPKQTSKDEKGKAPRSGARFFRRLIAWDGETQRSVLFWITVVIITYFLVPPSQVHDVDFTPGDIAKRDIKASRSILVEDKDSTQARRLEAEASVLSVFVFDRKQMANRLQDVRSFFASMRELLGRLEMEENELRERWKAANRTERLQIDEEIILFWEQAREAKLEPMRKFIDDMALEITTEQMQPLLEDGFSERSEGVLAESLLTLSGMGIISDRELLLRERGKGVTVRYLDAVQEEIVLEDFASILTLKAARSQVKKSISTVGWTRSELPLRRLLESLAQDLVRPNFNFDPSESQERKEKAVEDTKPVYYQVKRGEIIVRAGDPLTGEQILKIAALYESVPSEGRMTLIMGLFILTALILFAFYRILASIQPDLPADTMRLVMLAVIIVGHIGIIKLTTFLFQSLSVTYSDIKLSALSLAAPYAAGAMVTSILFPVNVGLVVASLSSMFAAILNEWSLMIFIFALVGSITAAFSATHCVQRSSVIRAGLVVGGVNMGVALILALRDGDLLSSGSITQMVLALGSGVGVSLLASLVVPIMESGFGVASDMKLMELANLNQPILKEMILRAPGSYHHSVLVGSLAEAAAEEIGANPLLARVASSYHDIGKINKPEYFIENQETKNNRHEKLSPSMSALILASHVKDGVEIAKEKRLPKRILDIIRQHHGTRLITFFYSKAKEKEDPSVQTVDEKDFRYLGPKPQSREAALIMLADAVEAASKVLDDPTPARIRGLVQKIINDIFVDGQLDESNLTLRDLHQIAKSFTRTITGILHHRIDYPDTTAAVDEKRERKRKKLNGADTDKGQQGETPPEKAGGPGVKNIRRLGQS
ncbi:MAG: HDIG domain-containing protein [bacterium]|nr:MAG: HDIG domain-containing protein [bacterium]